MQVCKTCGIEKPLDEYSIIQKKWTSRICKDCKRKTAKAWTDRNIGYFLANQKDRTRANKLKAIEYLGGKCLDCGGVFHPAVFDFHHRDPKEKEISPNKIMGRAWENMVKELDKCDLLCANCHRLRHHASDEEGITE